MSNEVERLPGSADTSAETLRMPIYQATPRELLPTLFTPMVRSRLWRPFSDERRDLAARLVIEHVDRILLYPDSTAVTSALIQRAGPSGTRASYARTTDRLSAWWLPRASLGIEIGSVIPVPALVVAALNLIEYSIDQRLEVADRVNFGEFSVELPPHVRNRPDPTGVGLVSSVFADVMREGLGSGTWFGRNRVLRKLAYAAEAINLIRPPCPYEIHFRREGGRK